MYTYTHTRARKDPYQDKDGSAYNLTMSLKNKRRSPRCSPDVYTQSIGDLACMFHQDEGSALNVDGTAPWSTRGDSSGV